MPPAWCRFLVLSALIAGLDLGPAIVAEAQPPTADEIKAAETLSVPQVMPDTGPPGMAVPGPMMPPPGPTRVWGEGGFQLWFLTPGPLPVPIFTHGNPADPIPGALGQPGTRVIFGDGGLVYGPQAGVWLNGGFWLGDGSRLGLEAGGFWGARKALGFTADALANGTPPTYIPVFRPELGREGSFTLADPLSVLNGSAFFTSHSQIWGLEANTLVHLRQDSVWDISLLAGYEHLTLDEDIGLTAFLRDPIVDVDTTLSDRFVTRNNFDGAQLGSRIRWSCGRWTVDVITKIGFGFTEETVRIDGSLQQSGTGVPFPGVSPGGVFTQPSNIGEHRRDEFAVVPELRLKIDYELAPRLHLFAGYDCLYWSSVVRPGNQIDREINQTQQAGGVLVGPARPMPLFNTSSLWVQGMTFGIAVRY